MSEEYEDFIEGVTSDSVDIHMDVEEKDFGWGVYLPGYLDLEKEEIENLLRRIVVVYGEGIEMPLLPSLAWLFELAATRGGHQGPKSLPRKGRGFVTCVEDDVRWKALGGGE